MKFVPSEIDFVWRLIRPVLILCAVTLITVSQANAEDKADAKTASATQTVKIDDLTLTVPKTWKQMPPANRLRKGQFRLPPAKGEKEAVDLVIFEFGGGGGNVGANIQRWIGQFQSKGREAKVLKGTSKLGRYIAVEISGTYNMPIGPPIQRKTKALPNARMFAVILLVEAKKKVYYLKVAGGAKTVEAHMDAVRASFGADTKKEEKLKFPGAN